MSKRFFTGDQHFGHENILKYEDENRRNQYGGRFKSIDQMNAYLIDRWNARIGTDDLVYVIGDMSFKMAILEELMPVLNGIKILVCGNHDPFFKGLVNGDPRARVRALEVGFAEIHMQHEIEIDGVGQVKLCHFPYAPPPGMEVPDFEMRYMHLRPAAGHEKLLLHGHVHSQWKSSRYEGKPYMINVGVDLWNMAPVSEEEIVKLWNSGGL
jgi:calcineurin-like phosphoesterase family protein